MPIRKASRKYNSDYMSRICDEQLEQLEDRLTALYANASNEVLSEYTDWIAKYQKQDIEMRRQVEAAIITEDDYIAWREKTMLQNELYKQTVKSLTDILVNTDIVAMALVNDELPLIIAESYNFFQSLGWAAADEAGLSVGTFQIYNAESVQAIIKKNPDLLPVVDIPKDKQWNKDRINREITQSIIHGDSIPEIADRLQAVTNMDENAAIRNARTAMTGAENLGRNESFKSLKKKGIPAKFQWSATHDDRTRDTHILLDGTYQNDDGYFGEGILVTLIEYPGDPAGDPEEVYNCRCRASLRLNGIDHSQDGDLYQKFMKENYPDDWNAIKDEREAKEQAYQEKKQGAEERVRQARERKKEG